MLKKNDFSKILKKMGKKPVLVAGDIMLDMFVYGTVERISPEGPVPVLKITRENRMLGGCGNVAANLAGLGVPAVLAALVGEDAPAQEIRRMASALGAQTGGLITEASRPTTVKTRYIARAQQLLRTDFEHTQPPCDAAESALLDHGQRIIPKVGVLILSDYNKGTLTPRVIRGLIDCARQNGVPVLVDPKGNDYTLYAGANMVTPNKNELKQASGMPTDTDEEIEAAARRIIDSAGIDAVIATRAEDGISVVPKQGAPTHIGAQARDVYDVSGAGDTVVAVLAAAMAAGAALEDAAALANCAGGIVVGKTGTAAITKNELSGMPGETASERGTHQAPLLTWAAAKKQVAQWQAQGRRVGFTNGCFDIVHQGHTAYLNAARARCDRLVLALNHDRSVTILKGPSRPINGEQARAAVIGALSAVDLVVLFGADEEGRDNTPCALIESLRPDLYFKGGDYTEDRLPEARVVRAYGGTVDIMPLAEGYSTTAIIEKSGATV